MPLGIEVTAIVPKHSVVDTTTLVRDLDRQLVAFAGAVIRDQSDYPPVRPWARGFPKSGPRKGGRRTGRYGRNWKLRVHRVGTLVEASNLVPYAVFVGGPREGAIGQRQARFQGRRGWTSISDSSARRWFPRRQAIVRIMAATGHSTRPLSRF